MTVGEALLALKARSGVSLHSLALAAGFRGASSLQRYFNAAYDPEYFGGRTWAKLADVLEGLGNPPISKEDLHNLIRPGVAEQEVQAVLDVPKIALLLQDAIANKSDEVTIYAGKPGHLKMEVEQRIVNMPVMQLQMSQPFQKLPVLGNIEHKRLTGIMISTDAMAPRFERGEVIFYRRDFIKPGMDVVVVFGDASGEEDETATITIARLEEIDFNFIRIKHLGTGLEYTINRQGFHTAYPIINAADLITRP